MEFNNELLKIWCENHFDEQLALLKELAAIPSPSHHEEKRAAFIRDWLVWEGAGDVRIDDACNVGLPFGCGGRNDIRVYRQRGGADDVRQVYSVAQAALQRTGSYRF